ncbi:hypothetical protein V502_01400 [Pseudogymnoascus sp. VKM F-4520 (FW-2644)]|nr:hypothetical protein V502_01400 [Pseudogymnoascus sp. VKM F-4520 (FW-2644)]
MAPTILIVGATGNTGKSAVRQLSKLLESSATKHRIVGLTRSLDSPASQELALLSNVEMVEKDWTSIDATWLKNQDVIRAYVAPHNLPSQFVDESALYSAMLQAGVRYVVKLSTTVAFLGPTNPIFYGRSHWAIETMLCQPEFKSMQWTALRPNFFAATFPGSSVDWIKKYKETGTQETLSMVPAADASVALIDPADVGNVAAHLLALEDPSPHNHAKYVLSGPEDVSGEDIVRLVEKESNGKVGKTEYKDMSFLPYLVSIGVFPRSALTGFPAGSASLWDGESGLAMSPTSKEILELAPPKRTVAEVLKAMLEG